MERRQTRGADNEAADRRPVRSTRNLSEPHGTGNGKEGTPSTARTARGKNAGGRDAASKRPPSRGPSNSKLDQSAKRRRKQAVDSSDEEFEEALRESDSDDEDVPEELVEFEKVEKILAWRYMKAETDVEAVAERQQVEYYVKWKGQSYLHCTWVSKNTLEETGKYFPGLRNKVRTFDRKALPPAGVEVSEEEDVAEEAGEEGDGEEGSEIEPRLGEGLNKSVETPGVDPRWITVERIADSAVEKGTGKKRYLVKWEGLGYDEMSWEFEDDLQGPETAEAIKRFQDVMSITLSARKRQKLDSSAHHPQPKPQRVFY